MSENNHVVEQLSAFLHDELEADAADRIRAHLLRCSDCRTEHDTIRHGTRMAARLRRVPAPEGLWHGIESRLDEKPGRVIRPTWSWVPAVAALVLLAVGAVFLLRRGTAPEPWRVVRLDGSPRIGTNALADEDRLPVGAWLTTDDRSSARIEVGRIGQVDVDPDSRVGLLDAGPSEHRLSLARGKLHARIWAPPRLFFVETPAALAVDLGCAYTLEIAGDGAGSLHVTSGWVELVGDRREVRVPAGAVCRMDPSSGPGVPYFEDAPESFRQALRRVEEGRALPSDLEVLLASARRRDALSLWYLLPLLEGGEAETVLRKLESLVPPPARIGKMDPDTVQSEIYQEWRERLEEVSLGGAFAGKSTPAPGTLTPIAGMQTARAGHSATLLEDGRVLVAGGWETETETLRSAEIFYPRKKAFFPAGSMVVPRSAHTATLLRDGRVLIAGGTAGHEAAVSRAELFHPGRNAFTAAGPMQSARFSHRATLLADGRVLITGGVGADGRLLRDAEIYDPGLERFVVAGTMHHAREGHTATLLDDGRVLVAGGGDARAETYDPIAQTFALDGTSAGTRYKHGAVRLKDGRVLLLGGWEDDAGRRLVRTSEIYDPAAGVFVPGGELATARYKVTDAVLLLPDGRVLVAGGGTRLELFDPLENAFEGIPGTLQAARFYSTATLLDDGLVLILGGYSRGMRGTSDAWIFRP